MGVFSFALILYVNTLPRTTAFLTPTPVTRAKGEIACYSCFSLSTADPTSIPMLQPEAWANVTDLVHIIKSAGLTVPVLAPRCADLVVGTTANPNFNGANIHLCPNSLDEPGACVKLKGSMNGEPFVYRDCWQRAWRDARPFHHRMSGKCFNDEMVQNFIATRENTICFCEDDLCNSQISNKKSAYFILLSVIAFVFSNK